VGLFKALGRGIASLTGRGQASDGGAPPPSSSALSALHLRKLRVAAVVRETADAVSLVFEDPGGVPIRFAPGQFFTLHVHIGDEVHKRAYSASSSALDPARVAVTIKRVHDGRVSRHLVANVQEGDLIEVHGPSGVFVPTSSSAPRTLVLVGGGSGITPLSSITRTLLASEPQTRIVLIYGNRGSDDIIFKAALEALAAEHAGRLTVRHVLQTPPPEWTGGSGLLDAVALGRELDALPKGSTAGAEYFLCGPAPMMASARACLEGRGVPATEIHEERFVSAHAAVGPKDAQPITVHMSGEDYELVVPSGKTVLETALDAGVDMPFSCTVGGCGACRVLLTSGTVAMDEPNCLSPQERADGYVLACSSRPTSRCTFEVT
jgi:ring-1,2-phenylacetyl-CoA epoxidase subunit PaaE